MTKPTKPEQTEEAKAEDPKPAPTPVPVPEPTPAPAPAPAPAPVKTEPTAQEIIDAICIPLGIAAGGPAQSVEAAVRALTQRITTLEAKGK